MRRTTVALDEDLLRQLKARAAREGVPLGRLVNDLLHAAHSTRPRVRRKVAWLTFCGDGLRPGVDLDDRRSLYDRMDYDRTDAPPSKGSRR